MNKILHIIPNLLKGGAERLVIDIIRELSKVNDVSVRLILFENKIEYNIEDIKQYIYFIPASVNLSITKKNEFKINELQQFINEYQPNIIHTHLFKSEIISRSCYYPKAKWFSHCHDNMNQFRNFYFQTFFNKKYLTNYFEKKYLFKSYKKNGGTKFIAPSNNTKTYFEQTAHPYHIQLLHNAIKYDRFFKNLSFTKNTNVLKLINVGSFQDKKNQLFLIEVSNLLKLKDISFEMHFLGDGKNRHQLEQKIQEYRLEKHVYLHGNVEQTENYLWQSDLYVHSATYEPFGLAIMEAMSAGLPIITLDGKGNKDLIQQAKNGYILSEQDPQLFAATILNLWNDKNKYQEMAVYAQQFAKQFDIKGYCDKLLALYKFS